MSLALPRVQARPAERLDPRSLDLARPERLELRSLERCLERQERLEPRSLERCPERQERLEPRSLDLDLVRPEREERQERSRLRETELLIASMTWSSVT